MAAVAAVTAVVAVKTTILNADVAAPVETTTEADRVIDVDVSGGDGGALAGNPIFAPFDDDDDDHGDEVVGDDDNDDGGDDLVANRTPSLSERAAAVAALAAPPPFADTISVLTKREEADIFGVGGGGGLSIDNGGGFDGDGESDGGGVGGSGDIADMLGAMDEQFDDVGSSVDDDEFTRRVMAAADTRNAAIFPSDSGSGETSSLTQQRIVDDVGAVGDDVDDSVVDDIDDDIDGGSVVKTTSPPLDASSSLYSAADHALLDDIDDMISGVVDDVEGASASGDDIDVDVDGDGGAIGDDADVDECDDDAAALYARALANLEAHKALMDAEEETAL
jgi:hypothetical protein